nr:RNase H family protein [Sphingomonas sp.]
MTARRRKVYFDGGCRPNPGKMEAAVVTAGTVHILTDLGLGTNCDAEWVALILAVDVALDSGADDFVLLGDSAIVVAQALRVAKCRGANMQRHFDAFAAKVGDREWPRIRKIARSQNLAGIALAKTHER